MDSFKLLFCIACLVNLCFSNNNATNSSSTNGSIMNTNDEFWMEKSVNKDSYVVVSNNGSEQRNLYRFSRMIKCYQPDLWEYELVAYTDYGCYCGKGGTGVPQDPTDVCCYVHGICYFNAQKLDPGSNLYSTEYKYECENATAECKMEENTPFKQALCKCDLDAAKCFRNQSESFNFDFRRGVDFEQCCMNTPPKENCTQAHRRMKQQASFQKLKSHNSGGGRVETSLFLVFFACSIFSVVIKE